jgi:hypothetical protein
LELAADVLKHIPETIDYEATYKLVADDMNPLNVVLLQEVSLSPPPLLKAIEFRILCYHGLGYCYCNGSRVYEAPGAASLKLL